MARNSGFDRDTVALAVDTIDIGMAQPFQPSFEAFARSEYQKLVGTLSLYCGDPEIAADVAHDALVRTLERWNQVRNHNSPSAWLFRVAFNLAHSRFRRLDAERRAIRRLEPDQPATSFTNAVLDRTALKTALLELPPYQRRVIVLRYYLELSVEDAAQYLGNTESSVKSATHRALSGLRRKLGAKVLTEILE